jgi:hypothetical protein
VNPPSDFVAEIASTPFPVGMEISSDGLFQGTPALDFGYSWDIPFKVTDDNRISAIKNLVFETLEVGSGDGFVNEVLFVRASPNPFTEELTITAEKNGFYHFQVMDMAGRRVAEVFSGHLYAGGAVSWNATGAGLKPGIYFLRWDSTHGPGVQKIIISG